MTTYVSKYNFEKEVTREFRFGDVKLVDTTLRDGEQTAGVVFDESDKLQIARMLAEIGVEQIEAGIPVLSEGEKKTIKKIVSEKLGPSIMCWSPASKEKLDDVLYTGCDAVAISLATSDIHLEHKLKKTRDEAIAMIVPAIEYAKDHGLYVSFNAEDGTRTDYDFLLRYIKECTAAGGDRLRLCDTVAAMNPPAAKYLVSKLIKDTGVSIEFHAHNDYGLAVANSIAACTAGAEYVSTTVNGLGERAGNASLEQMIMSLKMLYDKDKKYRIKNLVKLSKFVEEASRVQVSQTQPIIGKNMFRHESGIHAHGVIAFPYTYETFDPSLIGHKRELVIGRMSGKHAIEAKLKEYGIDATESAIKRILSDVKAISEQRKSAFTDDEFISLARSVIGKEEAYVMVCLDPKSREEDYHEISKITQEAYRVSGDIDLIIKTTNDRLDQLLEKLSNVKGVRKTETHLVIQTLKAK